MPNPHFTEEELFQFEAAYANVSRDTWLYYAEAAKMAPKLLKALKDAEREIVELKKDRAPVVLKMCYECQSHTCDCDWRGDQ